jgi:hypothetical protein
VASGQWSVIGYFISAAVPSCFGDGGGFSALYGQMAPPGALFETTPITRSLQVNNLNSLGYGGGGAINISSHWTSL